MKTLAIIELKKKIESFKTLDEKVDFLEKEAKSQSPMGDYSASLNYLLAENYNSIGVLVSDFYKKAAAAWEFAAMNLKTDSSEDKDLRKTYLSQAILSYKKARKICMKRDSSSESEELSQRISELNTLLRKEGGITKTAVITFLSLVFGISFLLLSSPPTGFVVSPLETDGTTQLGFIFVLIALIGTFLSIRWWLLSR